MYSYNIFLWPLFMFYFLFLFWILFYHKALPTTLSVNMFVLRSIYIIIIISFHFHFETSFWFWDSLFFIVIDSKERLSLSNSPLSQSKLVPERQVTHSPHIVHSSTSRPLDFFSLPPPPSQSHLSLHPHTHIRGPSHTRARKLISSSPCPIPLTNTLSRTEPKPSHAWLCCVLSFSIPNNSYSRSRVSKMYCIV
jgi:hypothetical protein